MSTSSSRTDDREDPDVETTLTILPSGEWVHLEERGPDARSRAWLQSTLVVDSEGVDVSDAHTKERVRR